MLTKQLLCSANAHLAKYNVIMDTIMTPKNASLQSKYEYIHQPKHYQLFTVDELRKLVANGKGIDVVAIANKAGLDKDAYMFKDTDDKYFTLEEYKTLIEANQKDKNDQLVYLYTTDKNVQATYIQAAKNKGYSVLEMNEESLDLLGLDVLERRNEKTHFARVDSDTINKLIKKEQEKEKVIK